MRSVDEVAKLAEQLHTAMEKLGLPTSVTTSLLLAGELLQTAPREDLKPGDVARHHRDRYEAAPGQEFGQVNNPTK